MKSILLLFGLCLAWSETLAQRNQWKPKDFQPLTQIPWSGEKTAPEVVVERIFREPNPAIRYPVLGEYLKLIPLAEFPHVFDLAVSLEGRQTPDELVSQMLFQWAQRDPVAAWRKTQELFKIVAIHGWLSYDSWENERIDVQDWKALQQSSFWLSKHTLESFAAGCDVSALEKSERVKLLKAFTEKWFQHFDSWPKGMSYSDMSWRNSSSVLMALRDQPGQLNTSFCGNSDTSSRACHEIVWRRFLEAHPDQAGEVIRAIENTEFPVVDWPRRSEPGKASISTEFLLVWRRVDFPGLKAWAASTPTPPHESAQIIARCMLLSEVEQPLRESWLKSLLDGDDAVENLRALAGWEPRIAMEQSVRFKDRWLELQDLVDGCGFGPLGQPYNTSHFGLGYLDQHGLDHLPDAMKAKLKEPGWFQTCVMEQWGEIDVGEAARFGLRTMLKGNLVPKQQLIAMYSGKESGSTDDGIIDRTFCALRVWAVVRPQEMKKWIESQDADMRPALLWMLENPWGQPK